MSESLFLVAGNALFEARLDGTYRRVLAECGDTTAVAAFHGDILSIEGNTLYYIHADDGHFTPVSRNWREGTRLMCVADKRVLIMEGGTLYEANDDGTYEVISNRFSGATWMCALGARLFIIEDDALEEVDPQSGEWRVVRRELLEVTAMAAAGGEIWVVQQDGDLYAIDPDDGSTRRVSDAWSDTTALAGLGDTLVALRRGTLYAIDAEGDDRALSSEWFDVKAMST